MKDRNLHKISLFDIIFIALLLASPFLFIGSFWHNNQDSAKVLIYVGNKHWATYNLEKDTIIAILDKSVRVKIKIEKNKIRIIESNCPRHTCEHTGWISNPGQTIICLPNKLLIEIKGKQHLEYDAASY